MILVSLFISKCAVAQNVSAMGSNDRDVVLKNIPDTINGVLHNSEDSMYSLINQITFLESKVCKGYIFSNYNIPNYNKHTSAQNYHSPETIKKVSTIKLNGFVNYEYYYNQHIDTPFAAKAFEQHTISAQLKITIKNKYPLVLNFSNRLTNNPFFKNYLDIGLQFDRVSYLNSLKNSYANAVNHSNPFQQILLQIQQELKTTEGEYSKLRKELNDPHWVQTIVKERESFLQSNSNKSAATLGNKEKELGKYSGTDSIKSESSEEFGFVKKTALFNINKSILSSFTPPKYDLLPSSQKRPGDLDSIGIKREKDSLNAKSPDSTYQFVFGLKDSVLKVVKDSTILKTHRLSDQANKQLTVMRKTPTEEWYEKQLMVLDSIKTKKDSLFQYSKKVEGLFKQAQNADVITGNINNRKQQLLKYGNPDNAVTKLDNILLNVKSFGIGRTSIDYSDLTARGLSILGIQAEFEPNLYYAFAAGKVNYRFRDFFVNTPSVNNNQEYYIVRIGNEKIKRIRIIGSAFYGKSNRLSLNNPTINLFSGYSIFTSYHISRTNFIEAEIAKTYLPVSLNPGLIKDKNPGLFDWSKNNNLGFEAKAHFLFMKSNTAVDGYYKRIGESFQSISFLTNDQIQKAWNIKVEQRLFKSKLVITGMLRQNDFVNPSFSNNYYTSSVFKT